MFAKLALGAATLLVLVGVPVTAETWAGAELDHSVRSATRALAPGAEITRVEPHGRPFLAALMKGEVSSAYADVRGPAGTTTLILQRLHRDTGRVNRVLWFSRVAQPVPLVPVKTADGAYSPTGTAELDGRQVRVTYAATVENGRVSVVPTEVTVDGRAEPGSRTSGWRTRLAPHPFQLPASGRLTVRAVSVGDDGITVELQQRDVDVRRGADA